MAIPQQFLQNLDGCDKETLRFYAGELKAVNVPYGDETHKLMLVAYATFKAHVMECRSGGWIDRASILERRCEAIYQALPEYCRW